MSQTDSPPDQKLLESDTEAFLRRLATKHGWDLHKRGLNYLEWLWTEFPKVKDLLAARPSELYNGTRYSEYYIQTVKKIENGLEKEGLRLCLLPPKAR
jgi:hypothetical protein